MKQFARTAFIAAALVSTAASAAEVEVFAKYAGTWKMQMTHVATPYSKPSSETMTVKNDCWHSENFYVCDQIIDGVSKALIVFFYDGVSKRYGSYPVSVGSDTVHPGEVLVDAKSFTFPWQIEDNGKTIHMRIVNTFTGPDTMDFRHEYSEDGQKWTAMATGIQKKAAATKAASPAPKAR